MKPFIYNTLLPDDTDDVDRWQNLFYVFLFLSFFFFLSVEGSDSESRGDGEAIVIDSFTDLAAFDPIAPTANFAEGTSSAGQSSNYPAIYDTTFSLVAPCTIAVTKALWTPNASFEIDDRRLLRALQSAPLIKALF